MVIEAVQTYVNLVNGVSKATREKARAAARTLLAQAGLEDAANDAGERVTKLADEILGASRANREMLENLVAAEVSKAATRLGFVRSDDLDEVREEIAELRVQLAKQTGTTAPPPRAAAKKTPTRAPAKKVPAKKAPSSAGAAAGETAAGPAARLAAEQEAATAAVPPARKAAPRKAPARRAPVRKAPTPGAPVPGMAPEQAATIPDPAADAGAGTDA